MLIHELYDFLDVSEVHGGRPSRLKLNGGHLARSYPDAECPGFPVQKLTGYKTQVAVSSSSSVAHCTKNPAYFGWSIVKMRAEADIRNPVPPVAKAGYDILRRKGGI